MDRLEHAAPITDGCTDLGFGLRTVMKIRRFFSFAAATAVFCLTNTAGAQQLDSIETAPVEPATVGLTVQPPERLETVQPVSAPRLQASSSTSDVRSSRMSTAELRQARALYRAQQRVARLEYNLWMGYEPLRPNWNAVPMMSSRYTHRRLYVPVYVHTR